MSNFAMAVNMNIGRDALFSAYSDYCASQSTEHMSILWLAKLTKNVFPEVTSRKLGAKVFLHNLHVKKSSPLVAVAHLASVHKSLTSPTSVKR